jgi:hypothetical protein
MVRTITRETKKEGQRKAKRCTTYMNPKKKKYNPFHDRKLSHPTTLLMSLACKS